MVEVFLFLLVFLLAYSNGANDISKGIATLVGSGTSGKRAAILWGVGTTALGSLTAVYAGGLLLAVFSKGVLIEGAGLGSIAAAVACGSAVWVLVSSRLGLPVSTTHALVGGIVGAGVAQFSVSGIIWTALTTKALLPLLLSPIISFGLSYFVFPTVSRKLARCNEYCLCVQKGESVVASSNLLAMSIPSIHIIGDEVKACEAESKDQISLRLTDSLHFLSGGLTSFARGVNDTPKIAALLVGAHAVTAGSITLSYVIVGLGIVVGGLVGGRRVIETLSRRITSLDPIEGFASNAVTAMLVTAGSFFGLPFSTTHVSTSSIVGIGVSARGTVHWNVVRDILFAWLVTLPTAGVVAFTIQKLIF